MSKRAAAEPLPEGAKRVAVDADQRDPSARDPRGLGDPSLRREAGAGKRLPKRKLALLLGYRGANYYGLQKQSKESDLPTIELALQEALNRAGAVHEGNQGDLSKIGWSRAARTDKRVSAARQVVSAKLEVENDDVPALLERLNGELPDDIKVFDAVRVIKGFNCKQSCDRRHYTYLLPTFLLAPDEAIDAAFDAVGYGPDRVADCRKRALAARAAGEHPTDWKLDDATAAEVATRLAPPNDSRARRVPAAARPAARPAAARPAAARPAARPAAARRAARLALPVALRLRTTCIGRKRE